MNPAPRGLDVAKLFEGVQWHQRWEVFENVFTPGRNPISMLLDNVQLPADLTGKRVLDIGAWDGAASFECERRGAKEVVALSLENPETTGFNRLKTVLGSNVQYVMGSVYNLLQHVSGKFDIVLFLGVIYHNRYPLLAADQIRLVTRGELFVESFVIDNSFIPQGKSMAEKGSLSAISPVLVETPLWQFFENDELGGDSTNWFGPNITAVLRGFHSAGFDMRLTKAWGNRAAFRGTPIPDWSLVHSYEGTSCVLQQDIGLKR